MKILLAAATETEIAPILDQIESSAFINHQLEIAITGVGMVSTAYVLGRQFATQTYDLAINAGIAGSFDRTLQPGEVVEISQDLFAEMGAEDDEEFLPIDILGLGESRVNPIRPQVKTGLKQVRAITVNRIHGNETTIYNTMSRFHPQVESMEGAAFFYSCNQAGIPSLQIRSVSNYVERRNRENWEISLAIKNLNELLSDWLKALS